jgi:hypothetical protein
MLSRYIVREREERPISRSIKANGNGHLNHIQGVQQSAISASLRMYMLRKWSAVVELAILEILPWRGGGYEGK